MAEEVSHSGLKVATALCQEVEMSPCSQLPADGSNCLADHIMAKQSEFVQFQAKLDNSKETRLSVLKMQLLFVTGHEIKSPLESGSKTQRTREWIHEKKELQTTPCRNVNF